MTFEEDKWYQDCVGRPWQVIKIRQIADNTTVMIVGLRPENSQQMKHEIAVLEETRHTATVLLDYGFTTIYDGEVSE